MVRQSAEHVPPVGDDGDQPRHGPAGLERVRGEAGNRGCQKVANSAPLGEETKENEAIPENVIGIRIKEKPRKCGVSLEVGSGVEPL